MEEINKYFTGFSGSVGRLNKAVLNIDGATIYMIRRIDERSEHML